MSDNKRLLEELKPETVERIARHFQDGAFVFDLDSESHTLREGNTVYTYDDFGEYIHIESDMLVSDFTMQRDERNNWYDRTETTVLFGETFTFRDRRNISYY